MRALWVLLASVCTATSVTEVRKATSPRVADYFVEDDPVSVPAHPSSFVQVGSKGICCAEATAEATRTAGVVTTLDGEAASAYSDVEVAQGTVETDGRGALASAKSAAEAKDTFTQSEIDSYKEQSTNKYNEIKNGPNEAKKLATALFKEDEKNLRANEKSWDDKLSKEESDYSKFISQSEKKQSNFMKVAEKDLKSMQKAASSWQKSFEKKEQKNAKAFNSALKKEEAKSTSEQEGYKEAVREQQATLGDLSEEIDGLSEDISGLVEKLLEGSGGQGVASALEYAAEIESRFYGKMDMDFERMEATHVVALASASDEISEMFEECLGELAEAGAEADESLAEEEQNAVRYLSKLSETMMVMEKKLGMAFKAQSRGLKKVERSESAVSAALSESKDNVEKRISKMTDEIQKRGDELGDELSTMLEQKVSLFSESLKNTHSALNSYVEKSGSSVENNALVNIAKVNQANERSLQSAISEVEHTHERTDEIKVKVDADNKMVEKVTALADTVQQRIAGYANLYASLEEKANLALAEAEKKSDETAEKLSKMTTDATGLLQKALTDAMAEASRGQAALQEQVTEASKAMDLSLSQIVEASDLFSRRVGEGSRHVKVNLGEAHEVIKTIERLMEELRKTTTESQQEAENYAGSLDMTMQEMRDALMASSKTEFEDNNNFVMSAIEGMSHKVAGTIGRFYDASQKVAAGAEETITDTAAKDAERAKYANQRLAQLAAEYGSEETAIKGADQFWAEHEESMGRFRGVMANFTANQENWKKMQEEFGSELSKEVEEKTAKMEAADEQDLEDMSAKVSGMVLDAKQTLKDAQAEGEAKVADDERVIEQTLDAANGQFVNVNKQVGQFKQFVQADSTGKDELTRAQRAVQALVAEGAKRVEEAGALDKNFAQAQSDVIATVNAETMSRDQAWAAAGSTIRDEVAGLKSADRARTAKMRKNLLDAGAQITAEERKSEAADAEVQDKIMGTEQGMATDAQKMGAEIRGQQNRISDEERQELKAVEEQGMVDEQASAQQKARSAELNRDIAGEAMNVEFEVRDAEASLNAILGGVDASAQRELTQEQLDQLSKLMASAQNAAMQKEGEVGQAAQALVDRMAQIMRSSEVGEEMLKKQISDAGNSVTTALQEAADVLADTKSSVGGVVSEGTEMVDEIEHGMNQHIDDLKMKFSHAAEDMERATKVGEYQGEEALHKVLTVVNNAQKQTDRLLLQTHDVLTPQMQKWRDNVEAIFSSLGLELDMERIEAQYQEGLANDTGDILSAEEQVEFEAHKIKKAMQEKQDAIRKRLSEMIRQVELDESLSEDEKRKRISSLKAMAGKATYQLMTETRRLLAGQGKVVKEIEEDLAELDSLAARADLLAKGGGGADAQRMMLQIMEKLKSKLGTLRHWINSGEVGSKPSLLEVEAGQSRLDEELRRAVARELALKAASVGMHTELQQDVAAANTTMSGQLAALAEETEQEDSALEHEDKGWDSVMQLIPKLIPTQA